jgi:hypothetical protein
LEENIRLWLLLLMGATFLIGCIPSYETIGFMAPLLVLILRLFKVLHWVVNMVEPQLVAEHAPVGQEDIGL